MIGRAPSEHAEQVMFVHWLRANRVRFFAVPNGGWRHKATAGKLKAEGAVPGVPDLIIIDPPPVRPGVAVVAFEMKSRAKGARLSTAQRAWHADVRDNVPTVLPVVARGAAQAIEMATELGYALHRSLQL